MFAWGNFGQWLIFERKIFEDDFIKPKNCNDC